MAREAEIVVLFADIAGSTRLYEQLGDARARAIVTACIGLMGEAAGRHEGRLVKTIGDEAMCAFPDADRACAAAVAMQDAVNGSETCLAHALSIRVGFHQGPALVDEADLHGDTVNVAAHVTSHAKAGQILTTAATSARMSEARRAETRPLLRVGLKNKEGAAELHEVIWQRDDMTMLSAPLRGAAAGARLRLTMGGRRITLGEGRAQFSAGRDERNDHVVNEATVSRLHARIAYRDGRFVLTDQSANGTFLTPDHGPACFLHRESSVLSGAGLIGLGAPPDPGSPAAIRYEPA